MTEKRNKRKEERKKKKKREGKRRLKKTKRRWSCNMTMDLHKTGRSELISCSSAYGPTLSYCEDGNEV
jgi:hypothetical protein